MKQLIAQTPSTNTLLAQMAQQQTLPDLFTLYTFRQTAGRGQRGNTWESEDNKNLTFSTLFHLEHLPVQQQFRLSQIVPLAIKNVLDQYTDNIRIKWPNDIYWRDKKICGILIEHTIMDNTISQSIAGVGLNINQQNFVSDAPNPISLSQITGKEYDLENLLDQIIEQFNTLKPLLNEPAKLKQLYFDALYRKDGFYSYRAGNETFEAQIIDVADNGLITLCKRDGTQQQFAFKEVAYII